MRNAEKFQPKFTQKEPEAVAVLSREQMKEELLRLPKGVSGMVWHVGSDPSEDSFSSVVAAEAKRYGFVSWVQGNSDLEGMNIQPHYFPQFGLVYDRDKGKIILNPAKVDDLQNALGSEKGFDFHPDSTLGWHKLLQNADSLGRIQLLKTHLATPACSKGVLSEEVIDYQPFIYRALVRGHVSQAGKLASRIVMSVDDPNLFSVDSLKENLSIMFGDEFNDKGHLVSTETDIIRAIHCCGDYDMLGAMETEAIDVVHWDAWKYGSAPLTGKPEILKKFTENNGMFAWGGIPQNLFYLQKLGQKIGISIDIKSIDSYRELAKRLEEKTEEVFSLVSGNYLHWLDALSKESGSSKNQIARRTFIGATCGYGGNNVSSLRQFSYNLSRSVADLNREIAK